MQAGQPLFKSGGRSWQCAGRGVPSGPLLRRSRRRGSPASGWWRSWCAPRRQFQSPFTGLGSRVALMPPAPVNGLHILADAIEQPAGQPQVVANGRRADWADLKLPLRRHNLAVDTGNCQPGVQAGVQVLFNHGPAVNFVGADTAVVAALGCGEAVVRPAQRLQAVKEGVLLLNSEPPVQVRRTVGQRRRSQPGCWKGGASCL